MARTVRPDIARQKKIEALYRRGWSLRRVAAEIGLTYQRIYQLLGTRARDKCEASQIRWARDRKPRKRCLCGCGQLCKSHDTRYASRRCAASIRIVPWRRRSIRWVVATRRSFTEAIRRFAPPEQQKSSTVGGLLSEAKRLQFKIPRTVIRPCLTCGEEFETPRVGPETRKSCPDCLRPPGVAVKKRTVPRVANPRLFSPALT